METVLVCVTGQRMCERLIHRGTQVAQEHHLPLLVLSVVGSGLNDLTNAAVAEAVDIPIVLYNIPARTGNALAPETVARLSRIENIVGAKDSSGNWDNMKAYLDGTRGSGFAVLSGNDGLILDCLKNGGRGGVAGCANVYPRTMASIYDCFAAGDLEKAQEYQASIASFRACFKYGNPNTVVKTAVALLGYDVGKCRAPFNQLPEEGVAALRQVLRENAEKGMH